MAMMVRRARVASSDVSRVREWVRDYTKYLREHAPDGGDVHSWTEAYGDYGVIYWTFTGLDLAALDAYLEDLPSRQPYLDILKRGSELFISGHTTDTLLKEIA
jgi:hypothetical protein